MSRGMGPSHGMLSRQLQIQMSGISFLKMWHFFTVTSCYAACYSGSTTKKGSLSIASITAIFHSCIQTTLQIIYDLCFPYEGLCCNDGICASSIVGRHCGQTSITMTISTLAQSQSKFEENC